MKYRIRCDHSRLIKYFVQYKMKFWPFWFTFKETISGWYGMSDYVKYFETIDDAKKEIDKLDKEFNKEKISRKIETVYECEK